MKKLLVILSISLNIVSSLYSQNIGDLLLEAESFSNKGGWVTDQQFADLMGSSYLMAHGMGIAVADAETEVLFPEKGEYQVFVRTYNWTSPWSSSEGPGKFQLTVDGKALPQVLGASGSTWMWQRAGTVSVTGKKVRIGLHDLTGFNGRCDAICFTREMVAPPDDPAQLAAFREKLLSKEQNKVKTESFDLVVVGGGVAGTCAAISAARLGVKVALIQDRPVLGGNNSSEVRVHLGGQIKKAPYPALGDVVKEIGPSEGGNARPASYYEDAKKLEVVAAEPNIKLFLNYRAYQMEKSGNRITNIVARHTETGEKMAFAAPLFADCTGDGTIGFLAGAKFMMGRESKAEFGEETAPEVADKLTMGSSVQWYSVEENQQVPFPDFRYGVNFGEKNMQQVKMGEWTWETGMNFDQINDFERIRDYGLMVVYSNWSFLKNQSSVKKEYEKSRLDWVAYIAGKRESRRLIGDYILKEQDIRDFVIHPDASFSTTWSIDLHYPDPDNTVHFSGQEFKSIAKHINIHPYPVPYRCLYSRDVANLFMAGRNISVTHVALGTVRVMRTTGMMGEVVGMAAAVCKTNNTSPRGVYENHLGELKALMMKGVWRYNVENRQNYNTGGTLGDKKF